MNKEWGRQNPASVQDPRAENLGFAARWLLTVKSTPWRVSFPWAPGGSDTYVTSRVTAHTGPQPPRSQA